MDFDPMQYAFNSNDSLKPAKNLIEIIKSNIKIDLNQSVFTIVDLGCGPGNSTRLLAEQFPSAIIFGLDIDPTMIEYANQYHKKQDNQDNLKRCHFFVQNLDAPWEQWNEKLKVRLLERPVNVIFSNYALQWIDKVETLSKSIKNFLDPDNGLLVINILYSDIMSVTDNEKERLMIKKYLDFPDEQCFIGNWLSSLKNHAGFNQFQIEYAEPSSIFPENFYKESFSNIPLKWHMKFLKPEFKEMQSTLADMLKKLILKKRIKKILPRNISGINKNCDQNNNPNAFSNHKIDEELNDIEIINQIWIIVAKKTL